MGNVFGTESTTPLPSRYYLGLSTTAPNVGGSGVTEPSDPAYARVPLTSLSAPVNGIISNEADIDFEESTVDWGTCTYFVVYDSATGGNLLLFNPLDKPRTVQSETQVAFREGGLTLSLRNPTA